MKERHIDSLHGWVSIGRMRYYCRKCRKGFYPLDRCLKLSQDSRMSEQKEKQLALLAVHMPYEEAKKIYEELTRQKTGRMTAHRTVERLGSKVAEVEAPLTSEPNTGETKKHITADGVMIHIREEGWKEAKVGAVYEVDHERKAQATRYTATLESRELFGDQLYQLAGKPEAVETSRLAFVSDAAKWLDELQALSFPLAVRIVDFWHVTEYLWKVANAFYEEGTAQAKEWAHEKITQLRQGRAKLIQASLLRMKPKTKPQREILNAAQTYFHNHAHQMDYPRYEAMGLHIGSGVGEAACKFVIQTRFKRSGMRWTRAGGENLLRLRLVYLNDQWGKLLETMKN